MKLDSFKFDKAFLLACLSFAVPVMLQQVINSLVSLLDNLMVASLGDIALSGVTAANQYYFILQSAIFGFSSCGSVFIAQFYGAKDHKKLIESFNFTLLISIVVSVLFFVLGLFFKEEIIAFFIKDDLVVKSGVKYFNIILYTYIPLAISIVYSMSIRSCGETKIPLIISTLSVFINAIFNFLLIFGLLGFPRLELAGAAIATLIARVFEMICFISISKIKDFPINSKLNEIFDISIELSKKIFLKAIPLSANEIFFALGMALLTKFYSTRGTSVMSGMAVASTISNIFFILFGGMSIVTNIYVSQKLGANKIEEARENAYKLFGVSAFLSIMFSIGLFISAFLVQYIFFDLSSEAKQIAFIAVIIQAIFYVVYNVTTQCYFTLRAGGDNVNTLIMDSLFMWAFNIPVMFLLAYFTEISFIYLYLTGQFIELIKLVYSFRIVVKETWLVNLAQN